MFFALAVRVDEPLEPRVVAIIVVGKSVSASLAQIGASPTVLVALGQSLVLVGALISIALNSLVFGTRRPALHWIGGAGQAASAA